MFSRLGNVAISYDGNGMVMVEMKDQEKTPLRTIIKQFLNHVENLEILQVEDSYEKEFQDLKSFSEKLKTLKEYSCSEGENEVNRKKNRYKDILPFDNSRVKLSEYVGIPGSNYINANFIRGASGSPAYIASQGPLPHTVNDFWRMVVEWDVQVIIMACSEEEAAKHKCEHYWVENEGEEKEFGLVSIRLVKASVVCADFLVRTMLLKYKPANSQATTVERTVCQFHYMAWPDHGVPSQVRPLLDMVRKVRETQSSETLPVLVHCSAGCGRTGTICAIDYVWGLLRAGKLTQGFSLFKLVEDMRRQRIAMVQTKEQYVLIHQAVRELFCEQLCVIDSHPYENIDVNGMPLVKVEEEESVYIVIGEECVNEEKQDGKEKELQGKSVEKLHDPVISNKKKGQHVSSKQEKEVENLTEKQRLALELSTNSNESATSTSLLHKPKIAKLKALFERSPVARDTKSSQAKSRRSQQVTRSHSLEATFKSVPHLEVINKSMCEKTSETSQPIPCKGILRVPQLSTMKTSSGMRPALPVKRSKSLKVLGSSERFKLSVPSTEESILKFEASGRSLEGNWGRLNTSIHDKCSSSDVLVNKHLNVEKPSLPQKKISRNKVNGNESTNLGNAIYCSQKTSSSEQSPKYVNFKSYDNVQFYYPPYRRRRSLESINLDDVSSNDAGSSLLVNTGSIHRSTDINVIPQGILKSTSSKSKDLDTETQRLLQDCRDYLDSSSKSDKPLPKKCWKDVNECQASEYLLRKAQFQNLRDDQRKINTIVARLGIRERRNSFRQAISTSRESSRTNDKVPNVESKRLNGATGQRNDNGSVMDKKETAKRNGCDSSSEIPNTFQDYTSSNVKHKEPVNGSYQAISLRNEQLHSHIKYNGFTELEESSNLKLTHLEVGARKKEFELPRHESKPLPSLERLALQKARTSAPLTKLETAKGPRKNENGCSITHTADGASYCVSRRNDLQVPNLKFNTTTGQDRIVNNASLLGVVESMGESRDRRHDVKKSLRRIQIARTEQMSEARNADVLQSKNHESMFSDDINNTSEATQMPLSTGPGHIIHSTPEVVSYGLVAGVQLRQGSQDGPTVPPRVRRHASVVLLRRSLVQVNEDKPQLTIWNSKQSDQPPGKVHEMEGVRPNKCAYSSKPEEPQATIVYSLLNTHRNPCQNSHQRPSNDQCQKSNIELRAPNDQQKPYIPHMPPSTSQQRTTKFQPSAANSQPRPAYILQNAQMHPRPLNAQCMSSNAIPVLPTAQHNPTNVRKVVPNIKYLSSNVHQIPVQHMPFHRVKNVHPSNAQHASKAHHMSSNDQCMPSKPHQMPSNTQHLVSPNANKMLSDPHQINSNSQVAFSCNSPQMPINTPTLASNAYQMPSNSSEKYKPVRTFKKQHYL